MAASEVHLRLQRNRLPLTQSLSKGVRKERHNTLLQLSHEQARRLASAPVGHLSTASKAGAPHVIPVCFALDPQAEESPIYIVLDQKPKRAALIRLRRVRNILENPRVALVVDHYDADWTQLWYILLTGTAELLELDDPVENENGGSETLSANSGPVERSQLAAPAHPEPVEGRHAIQLLRQKYSQYRDMDIDDSPVIKITPQRVVAWSYTPESTP